MSQVQSARASAFEDLKSLMGVRPLPNSSENFLAPLRLYEPDGADDRTIVLILGAFLEQSLETALLRKFIPMDDDEVRQLTFYRKIQKASAVGAIGPKAKADLIWIKNIRNAFAHSRKAIDFRTPEVIAACDLFTLPERDPIVAGSLGKFLLVTYTYARALILYGSDGTFFPHLASILDLPQPPPPKSR